MPKKCFSLMLTFVFFCTTSGGGVVLAQDKTGGKLPQAEKMNSQAEKIKRKVVARGTGAKARARVKLADGTKLKGYISEFAADDFTMVRTDGQPGTPIKINYRDVAEFKAQGKGMSTTSKVLIGAGVTVGVAVVTLALIFRNYRFGTLGKGGLF